MKRWERLAYSVAICARCWRKAANFVALVDDVDVGGLAAIDHALVARKLHQFGFDSAQPGIQVIQRIGRHFDALIEVGDLIALREIKKRLVGAFQCNTHFLKLVFEKLLAWVPASNLRCIVERVYSSTTALAIRAAKSASNA